VRTKQAGSNKGGGAAGDAVLDSPCLLSGAALLLLKHHEQPVALSSVAALGTGRLSRNWPLLLGTRHGRVVMQHVASENHEHADGQVVYVLNN
jgi:hypothetical protein